MNGNHDISTHQVRGRVPALKLQVQMEIGECISSQESRLGDNDQCAFRAECGLE